jgi:hypothetical protein
VHFCKKNKLQRNDENCLIDKLNGAYEELYNSSKHVAVINGTFNFKEKKVLKSSLKKHHKIFGTDIYKFQTSKAM